MNTQIVLLTVAMCWTAAFSARLDNGYLPPRGQAGSGAGVISPPGGGHGFGAGSVGHGGGGGGGGAGYYNQPSGPVIPIISYNNNPNQGDGSYSYSYESGNGIKAQEAGKGGPGPDQGTQAAGAFSYTGTDGHTYSITYTADEGGFRPQGAHLPTPPPIPKEILDSLALQGITANADGSFTGGNPNDSGAYNPAVHGGGAGGGGYGAPAPAFHPGSAPAPAYRPSGAASGTFSASSGYHY